MRALLAGGLVLGVGATATIAAWTDQELASTAVAAGTFSIVSRVGGSGAFTAANQSTNTLTVTLDPALMYPGQAKAVAIQVKAGGSLGGPVNMTAVSVKNAADGTVTAPADVALQGALTLGVKVTPATIAGAQAAADACTTATVADVTVTGIQNLPALSAATLTVDQAGTATNVISYCLILKLPDTAPGTAQGGALKPTWTFTGSTS
ncbi:SipW-dependent-type signal peptide-containing protein [Streptomyces sp. AC495_CC817]|uniref:SipW-dependent-type signal peptide-containing protein n=1 Tax=Streptomyces sp. AC495_CC817 TaxID=2823900 RepID=UPI001C25EE89|nr:SipW-dependent-type signal peptide-containing protein [Streptomyces sp. AC495_CC817]